MAIHGTAGVSLKSTGMVGQDGFPIDPILLGNDVNRFIPGIPALKQPEAAALNTPTGPNVTGPATGAIVTRNGIRCVEMTVTGAGTISVWQKLPASWPADNCNGNVEMAWDTEDASGFAGGVASLRLYTSNAFTTGMAANTPAIGTNSGWSGVHIHAPMVVSGANINGTSDWVEIGGTGVTTLASTMQYTMAKFTVVSAAIGKKIWLYYIVGNQKRFLPGIYIGADDCGYSWYTDGLPILEKYGLRGYHAYIHDFVTIGHTNNSMSLSDCQDSLARGHEFIIHGPRRYIAPDSSKGITNPTTIMNNMREYFDPTYQSPGKTAYDMIYSDIAWNRDGMVANGLDPRGLGRHVYVLPQGIHQPTGTYGDRTVENVLKALDIRVCRLAASNLGCTGFCPSPGYARSPLYIPIIGHDAQFGANAANEPTNIANLIAVMQSEIARGRSVVFMFHLVSNGASGSQQQIDKANLELICAAAATLINAGSAHNGSMQALVNRLAVDGAKAIG